MSPWDAGKGSMPCWRSRARFSSRRRGVELRGRTETRRSARQGSRASAVTDFDFPIEVLRSETPNPKLGTRNSSDYSISTFTPFLAHSSASGADGVGHNTLYNLSRPHLPLFRLAQVYCNARLKLFAQRRNCRYAARCVVMSRDSSRSVVPREISERISTEIFGVAS